MHRHYTGDRLPEVRLKVMLRIPSVATSEHLSAPATDDKAPVATRLHRLKRAWCALMHNDLTWPQHGAYRCRRCGVVYAVPWRSEGDERRP